MICLYKQLFCPFSTTDEDKDLEIQAKIRSVKNVMICLYKQLFCPFSTTDEDKDLKIQAKIRSVKNALYVSGMV
jgi:hypothetical protein